MPTLSSAWNFVKAHWQAIALALVVVVGYGWLRHQQSVNLAAVAQLNAAHQQEVDAINKARSDEATQHQQELQTYQQQLEKIQKEYSQAQQELQVQQAQETSTIVQKYGNDSKGLADLAASKFGFTVQLPPQ